MEIMSKAPANIQEIEDYLSGKLSEAHLAEFEERLLLDKELQNDVEITKKIIEGVEGYAFKKELKDLHQKFFGDSNA